MDEDERILAALPTRADQIAYCIKRMRAIQFAEGIEGVNRFRDKHPIARTIRTMAVTTAYEPKPSGYGDFILKTVAHMLVSDAPLDETNLAIVERMNAAMFPRRFNPANHLSKPLPNALLRKVADACAEHGVYLDTSRPTSFSKVRAVIRAARRKESAGRPFVGMSYIADGRLIIGSERFLIERYNDRECIRVTAKGVTQRVYLPTVGRLLAGLNQSITTTCSIGELVSGDDVEAETSSSSKSPEPDPEAETSSSSKSPDTRPTLSDRIAALKSSMAEQAHSATYPGDPDADPLAF